MVGDSDTGATQKSGKQRFVTATINPVFVGFCLLGAWVEYTEQCPIILRTSLATLGCDEDSEVHDRQLAG